MDAVSEIKARLPIEELVAGYCQLQKKGRNFVGLCPFHNDTRPSLLVSPEKGIAWCFPCQAGGDVFSFYQKIENVDFPQALRDLAEKTGVELPKERMSATGPKKDERERIRACLEAATAFYASELRKNEHALLYLEGRKVAPELLKQFSIGFAPDSFDATYTHLLKGGFSRKEILSAGFGVQKDLTGERIYDRFRNRVVFPIMDHQGGIVGFGGRTLGKDDAKYINSPDGPLYNKSTALFGLSLAKEAIRERKNVVLVEGYFDVLACHRLGIRHVVAVSGTALTEQHVSVLKRYAERVTLCLDADAAGEAAAERAFLLCKKHDLDVLALTLPTGKDPDECAAVSPEEMRHAFEQGGIPYLERVLEQVEKAGTPKREVLKRLLPLLRGIHSAVERENAITLVAATLGTTVTALRDDVERQRTAPALRTPEQGRDVPKTWSGTELLLGLLLTYPSCLALIMQLIEPLGETEKALYTSLKALYTRAGAAPSGPLASAQPLSISDLSENCQERAAVLALYCEEHFGLWSKGMAMKEIRKLCQKVNRELLGEKQKGLLTGIKQARALGRKTEETQLLTQYQQVLKLMQLAS